MSKRTVGILAAATALAATGAYVPAAASDAGAPKLDALREIVATVRAEAAAVTAGAVVPVDAAAPVVAAVPLERTSKSGGHRDGLCHRDWDRA